MVRGWPSRAMFFHDVVRTDIPTGDDGSAFGLELTPGTARHTATATGRQHRTRGQHDVWPPARVRIRIPRLELRLPVIRSPTHPVQKGSDRRTAAHSSPAYGW